MKYEDLVVLIPCHSLEDFPTELPDQQAASLLNSWVVPWHPQLIASAGVTPRWHRADDAPQLLANRLIMLPAKAKDWVAAGWSERARQDGAVVIVDVTEREEMLRQALEPLDPVPGLSPDLAADFLALGFCYLQLELLTRHMRHFSNFDEVHLQRETVAAAQAAVAGDEAAARTKLRGCFEVLTTARERFYPVDCYLLDLCLLIPRLADEHLTKTLSTLKPLNVIVTGEDLEQIAAEHPEVIPRLKESWEGGRAALVGGEYREAPTPLLPPESVLWQFEAGRAVFQKLFGRLPAIWGRRRFGVFPQLPPILQKYGYQAAMHVALDDGFYPDMEYSKVRWEGTSGGAMDAISRIPLAADGANSYLRLPQRLAESMDNDTVAAAIFARWPEVKSPFFEDLRRMHAYAPVLGRWVTLEDFFQHTDSPGKLAAYDVNEYLAPFFVQSVAREEADPAGRYVAHLHRRARWDVAAWYRGVKAALLGQPVTIDAAGERAIEDAAPDAAVEKIAPAEQAVAQAEVEAARDLAELIVRGGAAQAGVMILNPYAFPRTTAVSFSDGASAPTVGGAVKFVQWDEAHRQAVVELPPCGFVWLPNGSGSAPAAPKTGREKATPLAEPNVLRNEFFEVHLNEETGGIAQIKNYGRSPNRLSHQLAFRFSRERTIARPEEAFETKSYYSQMRVATSEVTCAGPSLGEIVTTGDILDQTNEKRLAGYRQTVRVWRGRPVVEVDVELTDVKQLPEGDPWSNYYAIRFAWNDSTAPLTRSVFWNAQGIKEQRFESPLYFEIVEDGKRTTILFDGLPFHRKTGERMLDTILLAPGETRRKFRFTVAVDQDYPLQAALDALVPPAVVPTANAPRGATSGWFFHLNARNVQLTRILPLVGEPAEPVDPWDRHDREQLPDGKGFAVRLLETEGRPARVHLRCFGEPKFARQRNFAGRTVTDLTVGGDTVTIDMTAYEMADVEVRF